MDDDIHIQRLVVGSLSANCYLVSRKATGEGLVVDPGGDASVILDAINAAGVTITDILLTHGHSDHIAALYEVQEATGAPTSIHTADADFLVGHGPYSSQFGISYHTPHRPDLLLYDGDIIECGSITFTVIHTPGHTPGSACFLSDGLLFTGDTLVRHSIGTTLMPGSSRRQLLESIVTKLLPLADDVQVYPGHGRATSIGEERTHNHAVTRYLHDSAR